MDSLKSKIPYEISVNDEVFYILDKPSSRSEYLKEHPEALPSQIGLVAIGAFREKSYVDYLTICEIDDVAETENWIRVHEQYEWLDWMAGTVYKDPEREKQLRSTVRELGEFLIRFGWSPDYVLEDKPSEFEFESFINHVVSKDLVGGILMVPRD